MDIKLTKWTEIPKEILDLPQVGLKQYRKEHRNVTKNTISDVYDWQIVIKDQSKANYKLLIKKLKEYNCPSRSKVTGITIDNTTKDKQKIFNVCQSWDSGIKGYTGLIVDIFYMKSNYLPATLDCKIRYSVTYDISKITINEDWSFVDGTHGSMSLATNPIYQKKKCIDMLGLK